MKRRIFLNFVLLIIPWICGLDTFKVYHIRDILWFCNVWYILKWIDILFQGRWDLRYTSILKPIVYLDFDINTRSRCILKFIYLNFLLSIIPQKIGPGNFKVYQIGDIPEICNISCSSKLGPIHLQGIWELGYTSILKRMVYFDLNINTKSRCMI